MICFNFIESNELRVWCITEKGMRIYWSAVRIFLQGYDVTLFNYEQFLRLKIENSLKFEWRKIQRNSSTTTKILLTNFFISTAMLKFVFACTYHHDNKFYYKKKHFETHWVKKVFISARFKYEREKKLFISHVCATIKMLSCWVCEASK